MNPATVRAPRTSKRPPPSVPLTLTLRRRASKKKIFFSDDLRRRWEQIVLEGRS